MNFVTKKIELNNNNTNLSSERKVIKSYEETPSEEQAETKGISFSKPAESVTETVKAEISESPEVVTEDRSIRRKERADAFKRAAEMERKAQAKAKEAQQMMAQARQFQEIMTQAKQDPTVIAKAMGMEPAEFLRKYQNQILEIKEEASPAAKEEEIKQRLAQYEQERQVERQKAAHLESQTIRNNYIFSKILPVISSDTEKYQLLNWNGKENVAGFIYDIMNSHYQKTGEELNIQEVAEEMENQLTKEIENKVSEIKKVSKFSRHFKEETSSQLGNTSSRPKTLSDKSFGSSAPGSISYSPPTPKAGSREERLQRVIKKFA